MSFYYMMQNHDKRYDNIQELFGCGEFKRYLQDKLPDFMIIANNLCLHNGRLGQEVGKFRERGIIYLFDRFLGEDPDRTYIDDSGVSVIEREKDVELFGRDVSIKTVSSGKNGKGFSQLKLSWVDDKDKASEFITTFEVKCDLLLVQISWGRVSGVYYISKEVQQDVFSLFRNDIFDKGRGYTKGTKLKNKVVEALLNHKDALVVKISWPEELRNHNVITQFWDDQYNKTELKEPYLMAM